jgi:hypothetical protein
MPVLKAPFHRALNGRQFLLQERLLVRKLLLDVVLRVPINSFLNRVLLHVLHRLVEDGLLQEQVLLVLLLQLPV